MQDPGRLPDPTSPRRLTRSSRDRMWAGVAGGMADYFDIDPSLVRLIWVAAAIITHGLAIPLYILAWIILPRDDRPAGEERPGGPEGWRDWSQEFHSETQRLADEARRMAAEVRGQPWHTPTGRVAEAEVTTEPAVSSGEAPVSQAATDKSAPPPIAAEAPRPWSSMSYADPARPPARHPRTTGGALVVLGIILLAVNSGWFGGIDWGMFWPLIFIGLGVVLLAKQFDWRR
jgi:phage shock protein C